MVLIKLNLLQTECLLYPYNQKTLFTIIDKCKNWESFKGDTACFFYMEISLNTNLTIFITILVVNSWICKANCVNYEKVVALVNFQIYILHTTLIRFQRYSENTKKISYILQVNETCRVSKIYLGKQLNKPSCCVKTL